MCPLPCCSVLSCVIMIFPLCWVSLFWVFYAECFISLRVIIIAAGFYDSCYAGCSYAKCCHAKYAEYFLMIVITMNIVMFSVLWRLFLCWMLSCLVFYDGCCYAECCHAESCHSVTANLDLSSYQHQASVFADNLSIFLFYKTH